MKNALIRIVYAPSKLRTNKPTCTVTKINVKTANYINDDDDDDDDDCCCCSGRVVTGYVITNSSSLSWQLIGTANPQWPQVLVAYCKCTFLRRYIA